MEFRHESKGTQYITGILFFMCFCMVTSSALKNDLINIVFGISDEPVPAANQNTATSSKPAEVTVPQPVMQTDSSGYEHRTDKNGNEVIIIPARYEQAPESAPIQAAPQQNSQVYPFASQQVSQPSTAPLQAGPPVNLTLVAMNAAAKAHTGMNVFESCRCNNGLATRGDLKQEVLVKCAQPVSRHFSASRDCREIWLYNFGPNEFMQGICFDGNHVNKVLSLDHGY